MPFAFEGKIRTMEYKTLRYPGHVAIMRPIRELGLISNTPIPVKGEMVVPRDLFIAAVQPRLYKPGGRDLVALRVVVEGERAGAPARVAFELLDYFDPAQGISAMMRTTGYSLSLTALMQADGTITARGVHTPDQAVPFRPYVEGLARSGIRIEERSA
jgi:lysine 6-dehydrogenase